MYGPSSNFGRVDDDDDDDDVNNRLLIIVRYADESIGKRSSDFFSAVTMTFTSSANADAMSMAQSPLIRPCAMVMASNPNDAIVASSDSNFLSSSGVVEEPASDLILLLLSLSVRVRVAIASSILNDVRSVVDEDDDDADDSSTADCCCCW
jgi:hypothetical protein